MLTALDHQEPNRLLRIQPTGPTVPAGGWSREGMRWWAAAVDTDIDQRSTSAMCALYQFMNRLIDRLKPRYTAMMMAMPSIACPVWFSVVLAIETISA